MHPRDNISFNVAFYDPSAEQPDWENPNHEFSLDQRVPHGSWGGHCTSGILNVWHG